MPVDPPIGSIMALAGPPAGLNEAQENWLICDGRQLDRNRFPALFTVIGTTWGGDGAPNFYLPDLRGQFLRGVDKKRDGSLDNAVDPDRDNRVGFRPPGAPNNPGNSGNDVGSFQPDAFFSHTHPASSASTSQPHSHVFRSPQGGGSSGAPGGQGLGPERTSQEVVAISTTTTVHASGGQETRPRNAYVYWIIRYR